MDTSKVAAALRQLDTNKDSHWTASGEPRIETVRMLSGVPGLTREELQKEFPDFNRSKPVLPSAQEDTQTTSSTPPAPPLPTLTETNQPDQKALAEPLVDLKNLETAKAGEGEFIHAGRDAAGRAINTVVTGTEAAPPAPSALAGAQSAPSAETVMVAEATSQSSEQGIISEREGIQKEIDSLNDTIADAEKYTAEVAKKVLELQARRDELVIRLHGLDKPVDPMEEYKKSVIRLNEEAARVNAAVGPAARALAAQLTGQSPLDQSIAAENSARQRRV